MGARLFSSFSGFSLYPGFGKDSIYLSVWYTSVSLYTVFIFTYSCISVCISPLSVFFQSDGLVAFLCSGGVSSVVSIYHSNPRPRFVRSLLLIAQAILSSLSFSIGATCSLCATFAPCWPPAVRRSKSSAWEGLSEARCGAGGLSPAVYYRHNLLLPPSRASFSIITATSEARRNHLRSLVTHFETAEWPCSLG